MLVTLEGIDGSGKSTLWEGLRDRVEAATFTREPTDSWYGEAVERSIADDTADPLAELFLYTADHADHLSRVVRPALEADRPVISDRYLDSRCAYQGVSLAGIINDPLEYVRSIHEPFTRIPDLTLYLDVPPAVGAERAGATNKFETVEYLESVRSNYERILETEPERFIRIDGTRPIEEILECATQALPEEVEID